MVVKMHSLKIAWLFPVALTLQVNCAAFGLGASIRTYYFERYEPLNEVWDSWLRVTLPDRRLISPANYQCQRLNVFVVSKIDFWPEFRRHVSLLPSIAMKEQSERSNFDCPGPYPVGFAPSRVCCFPVMGGTFLFRIPTGEYGLIIRNAWKYDHHAGFRENVSVRPGDQLHIAVPADTSTKRIKLHLERSQ